MSKSVPIDAYHDPISILLDLKLSGHELWLLAKLKFEFIIRIFVLKIEFNLKQIQMPSLIVVGKVTHSVFIKSYDFGLSFFMVFE